MRLVTSVARGSLVLFFVVPTNAVSLRAVAQEPRATDCVVSGRVADKSSGRGVAGAVVTISIDGFRTIAATVVSGENGTFELSNVPAGELMLMARKTGYSGGLLGQEYPADTHQVLNLAPGARKLDLTLPMWKNGVITGTVQDAHGEPVQNAMVATLRSLFVGGQRRWRAARTARTDDRGVYRISELTPGEYLILLLASSNPGSSTSNPAIFYPGAASSLTAAILSVRSGEVMESIDFARASVKSFRLSGMITGSTDVSPPLQVTLFSADAGEVPTDFEVLRTTAASDGRFAFPVVPVGEYRLQICRFPELESTTGPVTLTTSGGLPKRRQALPPLPSDPTLWAEAQVTIADRHVDNLTVALQSGARIHGSVMFEGSATPRPSPSELLSTPISVVPATGRSLGSIPVSRIEASGRFSTVGLPNGSYVVGMLQGIPGWHVASIRLGNAEISGAEIHLAGADLSNLVITLTDKVTQLSGTVQDSEGHASKSTHVMVFSTDRTHWQSYVPLYSARLRRIRTSESGGFRATLLPGEYFVVGVSSGMPVHWMDPDYLGSLVPSANVVRVALGESKNVSIRLK